jgi:hypothetical protein
MQIEDYHILLRNNPLKMEGKNLIYTFLSDIGTKHNLEIERPAGIGASNYSLTEKEDGVYITIDEVEYKIVTIENRVNVGVVLEINRIADQQIFRFASIL